MAKCAADKRSRRPLPIVAVAAIYVGFWWPALVLVAFFVPTFEELFSELQERGELPALTAWLMCFSRLNEALFYLPCLLVLALLVGADVAVARLLQRSRRCQPLYWAWLVGAIVTGILAAFLVVVALMLPIMRMSWTL
jgi:type II secretory pathway component PulF